ncbi:MAG: extracellular solute-binding protein, partial [Chloroflexi bacterium]|nr:extracellular solute-binding protein [Chloroflexota bacterium]
QVVEYARAGLVVTLTEYLSNTQYGLTQEEQEDLWPIALESGCRLAKTEQPMGLFFDAHAVVMFYNATWLKKLKADAPPQTWEEFREQCNAARDKKNATWGYAYATDGLMVFNWLSSLGKPLVDPRSEEALLDSSQAVAALSVLKDLIQDGCAYCTFDRDATREDFAAEKVLFVFGSTEDLPKYAQAILNPKTKKPKFTWSVAPMPHLTEEPLVSVQGSTMSILRTTPRQQLAAWLFIKWFLQQENDVQWALAYGALPLHKSSLENQEMKDYFAQNPQYELACQWMAYAQAEPAIPKWREIRELLVHAATMVCQGQAEPAEALAAADVAADNLLAR